MKKIGLQSARPWTLGKPPHLAPHTHSSLGFENEKITKCV